MFTSILLKCLRLPPWKNFTSCKSLFLIAFVLSELAINFSFLLNVSNSYCCDVSDIDQCFCFGTHIVFDSQGFEGSFFEVFRIFIPGRIAIFWCSLEKFFVFVIVVILFVTLSPKSYFESEGTFFHKQWYGLSRVKAMLLLLFCSTREFMWRSIAIESVQSFTTDLRLSWKLLLLNFLCFLILLKNLKL